MAGLGTLPDRFAGKVLYLFLGSPILFKPIINALDLKPSEPSDGRCLVKPMNYHQHAGRKVEGSRLIYLGGTLKASRTFTCRQSNKLKHGTTDHDARST